MKKKRTANASKSFPKGVGHQKIKTIKGIKSKIYA